MTLSSILLPNIAESEDKSSPLANRIRNNYRHLRKWAKRTNTNCFRIYDREVPHYPLSIDFYADRFCVHYFSGSRESPEPSPTLKEEVSSILIKLFGISPKSIFWRSRIPRQRMDQYEKTSCSKDFFTVLEYGVKFKVNLVDYLDTGLFLDHRETRQMVASLSYQKRVLNLFSYTASFSVHASNAGATFTKSVDMSNTYSAWARDNFRLNGLPSDNNEIIRADCLKFLNEEITSGTKYDIIVIDPPTISRSKKMDQIFDIQIDYIYLIMKALKLLSTDGIIFFSTNSRQFKFNESVLTGCNIQEISRRTLPIDYHDTKIHRCWKITKG